MDGARQKVQNLFKTHKNVKEHIQFCFISENVQDENTKKICFLLYAYLRYFHGHKISGIS